MRAEARRCRPLKQRQRQGTKPHQQAVLHLRKRYPLRGKRKIWKVLSRDHDFAPGIRTVARILKHLLASKQVRPVAFYYGRVRPKRKRQFEHHARRFLEYLITQLPYPLISIQVDGDSGFRDEFEQIGQALEIPVFVLAPNKPEYIAKSK